MASELYGWMPSKKVLIGAAVVVFLVVAGRCGLSYMFTSGEAHTAEERVRRIFDGMKQGGDRQRAIALWKLGKFSIPGGVEAFNAAATDFEAWEAEHELAGISGYEITGAEVTAETGKLGEATVIVSGTVDDRPFRLRVVQDQAVEWLD